MEVEVGTSWGTMSASEDPLTNGQIAELLAIAGDDAKPPLNRAYRRASRKALLWEEEAACLYQEGRSLTELPGVGPYLERIIRGWIEISAIVASPPATREKFCTLTQVRSVLGGRPLWSQGVKGDLQMHSVWSDGSSSIQEMAEAGEARGYEYIAITDHSKGLKIAGGIDEKQLFQQADDIAIVNESLRRANRTIRVLRSIEVNLSPHGEVDMDLASLAKLDIVLGCFHSALRKKEDQTDRYVAALRNPAIHILGHPRGRIYNFRVGLSADWAKVFAVAAELDKAVEIDSYPDRQDLSLDLLKLARKAGCRISIGTDAHDSSQLRFIEFGLAAALKAKIDSGRILNFMGSNELLNWATKLKESKNS
jgi:histidinol phosphatase-like PHP family hydrolase